MKSLLSFLMVTVLSSFAMADVSPEASKALVEAKNIAAKRLEILEKSQNKLHEIIAAEEANLAEVKKLQAYQQKVVVTVLQAGGYMTPTQSQAAMEKLVPALKTASTAFRALLEGQSQQALSLAFSALIKDPELRKLLGLDGDRRLDEELKSQLENAEAPTTPSTLQARWTLLNAIEAKAMEPLQVEANKAIASANGMIFVGWDLEKQCSALLDLYQAQEVFLVAKIAVLKSFLAN